ncbi:hypothetical protein [Serratia fonticola]
MSISLNFVIYQHKNGKLIEEDLKTIRFEEVSTSLLNEITSKFPTKKEKVYFDKSLDDSFDIECFSKNDMHGICGLLKELFLHLLRLENHRLNNDEIKPSPQEAKLTELIDEIIPDVNKTNSTDMAVARFRILTGVIGLFTEVNTKFYNDVGAVIKLGV